MIYLDNAATTLRKPQAVVDAVVAAMGSLGNAGRGATEGALNAARVIYGARESLATLFNAERPAEIAFTNNSTESLNMAISGSFKKGDHVITTAMEHNSVLRPLYRLAENGVEVTIIPADKKGCIAYEDFEKNIKDNTKGIVCTNGSNLTGNRVDLKRVGEICDRHKIRFIVDASQTAGVFPIDVQDMKIDILCFTGHKGLLGPQGTGGIYVRDGVYLPPFKCGGSGVDTYNHHQPDQMPTRLEAGTLNGHGIAGLQAGVNYLLEHGIDSVRKTEQDLMWMFYNGVKDIPGVTVYGDFDTTDRCPICTINIRDYDSSEVSDELLMTYDISTRPGAHCAPLMHEALGTVEQGAVRFSFSHFNTEEEIQTAINAVKILAEAL